MESTSSAKAGLVLDDAIGIHQEIICNTNVGIAEGDSRRHVRDNFELSTVSKYDPPAEAALKFVDLVPSSAFG